MYTIENFVSHQRCFLAYEPQARLKFLVWVGAVRSDVSSNVCAAAKEFLVIWFVRLGRERKKLSSSERFSSVIVIETCEPEHFSQLRWDHRNIVEHGWMCGDGTFLSVRERGRTNEIWKTIELWSAALVVFWENPTNTHGDTLEWARDACSTITKSNL